METLWFCLVTFMIAGYVVLDGFDIGAGIVHLFVARSDADRRQVFGSIGPVWDGNEVWLLAGGGVLYFAFPGLYASSFSGFYLPLMVVLWLLILRGISIEFRNHIDSPAWMPLWDVVFAGASTLLALFFGAALGNVIRGVPLDQQGDFFLPLWTDFRIDGAPGILDWFTILVALLATLTLTMHGALWINFKTEGELQQRALRCARKAWYYVAALTAIVTFVTFIIQRQVASNFEAHPWGLVFPTLVLLGLVGVLVFGRPSSGGLGAFLASCLYVVGMLSSAAFGVFPYVLPSSGGPGLGLTVYNTAADSYGLRVGLGWWIPGMLLAAGYFVFLYWRFGGKVGAQPGGH